MVVPLSLSSAHRFFHRLAVSKQLKPILIRNSSDVASKGDTEKIVDPGSFVSGLTSDQINEDPKLAAFFEANFSNKKDSEGSGVNVSVDVLMEWGFTEEDIETLGTKDADVDEIPEYNLPAIDAGLGTPEQQAINVRVLHTYRRQVDGSNACRRLRWQNLIPGVLYGRDAMGVNTGSHWLQTPWPILQRELDRYHRHFESRVYDLTVYEDETDAEGTVRRVVPRSVQRHPVKGEIYCANFLEYHAMRPIKIPIQYTNQEESPALKRDGFIIPINKFVECLVEDGAPIPEKLNLDCTGVQVKDVLRLDRIEFPDGVRPSDRINLTKFVVGPVFGGKGGTEDEDVESDAAGASRDDS